MIVKTYNGTKALKEKCRKIRGSYYEMNKQCFLMPDGKWHRINNGKITKDYDSGDYVFISEQLENGVIGRETDGTLKLGFFKKNLAKNVNIHTGMDILKCLNRNIAENTDAKECIGDGRFYLNESSDDYLNKKAIYKGYENLRLDYRCDSKLASTTKSFEQYFKGESFKHSFHKMLPEITFGIEVETDNGRVPQDLMMQNGLIPVKDGSLRHDGVSPYEYATIILNGKKGLQAISKQCELYNKYCTQSYMNSMHIHIGGIPITKEYVVAAYKIVKQIQGELYEMFPKSIQNTSSFKNQDYCNPLKGFRFKKGDVEYNFDKIYKYLAMDSEAEFMKFKNYHPKDPENRSKWNVKTRYSIVNFIPTIFGPNGTVEFRIHTSTFNEDKIVNWLYLISAICWYAYENKHIDDFKELRLSNVIDSIYPSSILRDYLKDYVQYRKDLMLKHEESGDVVGKLDVDNDNLNDFKSKVKSLIEHE